MPVTRRRTTVEKSTEEQAVPTNTAAPTDTTSQYVKIPLPRFNFRNGNYTPILIGLLLIASYLLGMLTTKVQYLEKGVAGTAVAGAQQTNPGTAPLAPGEPTPLPADQAAKIVDQDNDPLPSLGADNAKVTIVEYSDFQCPFCKRFFEDAYAQIKKEYVDTNKVKFVFRHYPLPFHANAQKAGEASECANEEGKFWQYHDVLFTKQTEWENLTADTAKTKFGEFATEVGIDATSLISCLDSGKHAQKVTDDMNSGSSAGVSGTPTVFINGRILVGAQPFSAFKTVIDEELAK